MSHVATRTLLLAVIGLVCLASGGQAHDRHHYFHFWFPPPPSPDVLGNWEGTLNSARFGADAAALTIDSQRRGHFSGMIALGDPEDTEALLPASEIHGHVTASSRVSIESYSEAGNFLAHGPIVDGVMQLAFILELPDGSMDAGLLSLSLPPPPD